MQGHTEGNNDPAEIQEKAKLETISPDPPPDMAKKPTRRGQSDQYPSLLVPIVETTYDPNKVVEDLSGTFIDDKPLSDGEQAYGGNTHGSQELVQVYPIGTGALVEEQLGKGGPETSDSERATCQVFQNPDDRVEKDAAVHTLLQVGIDVVHTT